MTGDLVAARAALATTPDRPAATYSWHGFDLATGRRGPRVVTDKLGTPKRILGEPTELTGLAVRIDPATDWQAATEPGRAMLVLLDDAERPLWAGLVLRRRSSAGDWVTVDLVTHEAYFDRRYVEDHTFALVDEFLIATALIGDAVTEGVQMLVDAPTGGMHRDRAYDDDEDKTVLSALDELASVEQGIEWTIDIRWADPAVRTVLERVVRVRDRVGVASNRPPAVFTMPGPVTEFEYLEDYGSEYGANEAQATSSGEGDTRPESARWRSLVPGWPLYQRRFTPSTSIIDQQVLDDHAFAEVRQTWDGLKQLTLTARASVAPRIGEAWSLGDDVAVQLTCPRFPSRVNADGARVPGYVGVVRTIGWELDLDADTVKPTLLEITETDVEAL